MSDTNSKSFDDLLSKVGQAGRKKLSVAVAQDKAVLEAVKVAKERGIADSILVGDASEIAKIAAEIGMNLDDYTVIDEKDIVEASLKAVKLVHDGEADMYMNFCLQEHSLRACLTRKSDFVPVSLFRMCVYLRFPASTDSYSSRMLHLCLIPHSKIRSA